MITFVSYHADFKMKEKQPLETAGLMNLLFRSAERFHPGCRKIILTDKTTVFPGLDAGIEIRRGDFEASQTMYARRLAETAFARSDTFSGDIVLIDSDMLCAAPVFPLSDADYDVAITYRNPDDLPYSRPYLTINGGVLFLKRGKKSAAIRFLESASAAQLKHRDKGFWWSDQYALADLVGNSRIPRRGVSVVEAGGASVLLVPGDVYNFSPDASYASIIFPLRGRKILHFKGRRKSLMPLYWRAHLDPAIGAWVRLAARWSIVHSAASETLRPPQKLKKTKRRASDITGRLRRVIRRFFSFPNARFDAALQRLISGRRVLILGSGPSAAELQTLPPDMLIFTCNAGLKLFDDRHFDRRPDLYFFVKSKQVKMLTLANDSLASAQTVRKMELMGRLLRRIGAHMLVTNNQALAAQGMARVCDTSWFDDGCHARYLKAIIRPRTPEEIRGSSFAPWTSTGMRLLQYALCFGASEIYVIGMDFGVGGYFWGPNPRDWRHVDIDENFIRIVAGRFKNVYSASLQSPLTRYLPFKSLDAVDLDSDRTR